MNLEGIERDGSAKEVFLWDIARWMCIEAVTIGLEYQKGNCREDAA
jgi:hypothetical protein